jgi:Glycosyl transferase family 2
VRLVMVMLVRDEADIVRENLDFHLSQGVDRAIVADHRSSDTTASILAEYQRRGAIRLIEAGGDYDQGGWLTKLARMAATDEGADWVIPNDADEFWWPRDGDLKRTFEHLPKEATALVVERMNFVPTPADEQPWWQRMTLRQRVSVNPNGRPMPPKLAHRADPELTIPRGNHKPADPDRGVTVEGDSVDVLHFQMRSYDQFERRVLQIGRASRRDGGRRPGTGKARRRLLRLWRDGGLPEYYASQVAAEAGDEVVEDTRLRDYLSELRA